MRGERLMHGVDYSGPQGGLIAGAVIATAVAITTFWMAIGATVWKLFFEPRIKELQGQLASEKARCDDDLRAAQARILQLESLLWFHGPQRLRQDMQAALSEQHIEMIEMTRAGEPGAGAAGVARVYDDAGHGQGES